MSANEKRIKEANECIQRAEEHLKTSIWKMKTKPNHDSAAYEYDRAAICFRNAEKLDRCQEMYLESAKCHANNGSTFHAAKAKESAGMAAKDAKDFKRAAELFDESATGYFESGSVDTAAQTLDKAGKMLLDKQENLDLAAKLYGKALNIVRNSTDKSKMVTMFGLRLISIHIKLGDLNAALKTSEDLICHFEDSGDVGKIGQLVLGMVLIELIKGDSIAALQRLRFLPEEHISSFSQELNAAKCLVKYYEAFDDESLQQCLKGGIWRSMDNEYLRLMKQLKAPEGESTIESEQKPPTAISANADDDDEEDLR
ncbi:soluble NSF attachment protein, SNAP domain-containing protein [Ditylenchus destructor]|nr:soluble NSF attachment protein, SNAP domain-containing protein [Ditylenchus destructor]